MKIILFFLTFSLIACSQAQKTIYDYSAVDINGDTLDFSVYKGKKILIVNTASECGLTPQYEDLEKLYQTYKDSNFVIVGFPANDFMGQEPGSNQEIAAFCKKNYGVSFKMMSKISVKGKDQHPIYQYLTQKSLNDVEDSEVKWNFHKYLIDENGKLVKNVAPRTKPTSEEITSWILN
jgi:glutathione peroxidase